MKPVVEEAMKIFESIIVHCVEGVEFISASKVVEEVRKEAEKGYFCCNTALVLLKEKEE